MKSFADFLKTRPIYIRRDGELTYDLSEHVYDPDIRTKQETKEEYNKKLKKLRESSLPKNWKGIIS